MKTEEKLKGVDPGQFVYVTHSLEVGLNLTKSSDLSRKASSVQPFLQEISVDSKMVPLLHHVYNQSKFSAVT